MLSPQSSRCSPRIQRSPVRDTGLRGGSGITTGGAPGPSRRLAAADVEGEQLVELGVGEADQRQVEVVGRQLLQLGGEQRLVPLAELGQLVVGQIGRPAAAPR